MKNLANQSVDRPPSNTALCRMMLECLNLAEAQLGETLSLDEQGIQTDGTTKFGHAYDVATSTGTYALGVRHDFPGSAMDSLDT